MSSHPTNLLLERSGTGTYLPDEQQQLAFSPAPIFVPYSSKLLRSAPSSADEHEVFPTQLSLADNSAHGCISSNKPKVTNSRRTRNEDRIALSTPTPKVTFAAVFDGHGGKARCSHFVSQRFETTFLEKLSLCGEEEDAVEQCLVDTFLQLDGEFRLEVESQFSYQSNGNNKKTCCLFYNENPCMCQNPRIPANEGSTGTVVYITSDFVYCANVGDSDAFCFFQEEEEAPRKRMKTDESELMSFVQLNVADTPTVDESNEDYLRIRTIAQNTLPTTTASTQRILPANGILLNDRGYRYSYVTVAGARSLNMVRAFGNLGNKRFHSETGELIECESPIICRPHVHKFARTKAMRCIVLGSDGLWDNVTPEEIVDCGVLNSEVSPRQISEELLARALGAKRKQDDISVVVINL